MRQIDQRKVVVAVSGLEPFRKEFERAAAGRADLQFVKGRDLTQEVLREADAVIGNPSVELLQGAKKLCWLQATNAGVERYTGNPAFPNQVMLTNMTGAFGAVISEYVLAGVLALYRRLFVYRNQQRAQLWQDAGAEQTLSGKRALILGAGDIGGQTARRLKAFDVSVTGIWRIPRKIPPYFDSMAVMTDLDTCLSDADLVIGCLPSTPETIHILDERRLRLMKKGAVLVNVGRGSLIDTDALVRVLREKRLGGAVLDVTEPEPLPQGHPLWDMEQVIVTPHISGKSFGHGVEQVIAQICCENLSRFLDGRQLRNLVDLKSGYADYRFRGRPEREEKDNERQE